MSRRASVASRSASKPCWHDHGDFLGDIAVICMKPDHGKRIAHQLQSLGIPHLHMATRTTKRAYDLRKPRVNILSVQKQQGP